MSPTSDLKSTFITQTQYEQTRVNTRSSCCFSGMFTPVSCVFEEAGGQFDSEDDPEERRPNCPFVLTSPVFSGALKRSSCGRFRVLLSNFFSRVEFVSAPRYEKPRSARRRLMGLSVCIFISARPDIILLAAATLRQADQVTSLSPVHLKLKRSPSFLLLLLFVCINNLPSAAATTSQSTVSHRCDCCRDDTNGAQTRWIWRD